MDIKHLHFCKYRWTMGGYSQLHAVYSLHNLPFPNYKKIRIRITYSSFIQQTNGISP